LDLTGLQQLLPGSSEGTARLAAAWVAALGLLAWPATLGGGLIQLFVRGGAVKLMVAVQPTAPWDVCCGCWFRRSIGAASGGCHRSLAALPSGNWMVGVLMQLFLLLLCSQGIGLMLLGVKLVVANALAGRSASTSFPNVGPTLSTGVSDHPWRPCSMPPGRPGGAGALGIVIQASRELRGIPPR